MQHNVGEIMSSGIISASTPVYLNGLSTRTTNASAQDFIPYFSDDVDEVGFVYSRSEFVSVWLWNGTDSPVTISDLIETEITGIIITGVEINDVIQPRSSIRVNFEITKYGPTPFSATINFVSTCVFLPTIAISGTRRVFAINQPRPIDMNTAMEEAYAYADPQDTFYDTLEFSSEIENDKIMVVNSDEPLQTPQGLFLACHFDCTLPETQGNVRGQMQINVNFLPRDAQIWIRKATQDRATITVIWRQYLGPDQEPDAWYPIPLQISAVEQTPTGVTATAMFPDLVNLPFPRRIMTTAELPGGII
jgi:hypothetical protein